MLDVKDLDYKITNDLKFLMEAENLSYDKIAEDLMISRTTLDKIIKENNATEALYEKIYNYIYNQKYRLNSVKEDFLKETNELVLFHGSKSGLSQISLESARKNCDFGKGFYLGESYDNALSFVCDNNSSSVYSFVIELGDLKIKKFNCSLEWMLAICYYRGTIKSFNSSRIIKKIIKEIEETDIIIAPIADNKMFYIMSQFANGDINGDVALHSLSASKLGMQYVLKTEKAISKLQPIEKYYLCESEKKDCHSRLVQRSAEIDSKLKLAKREFRTGLFIEEMLK